MVDIVLHLYNQYEYAKEWYENKIVDTFIAEENQVFAKWKKCFDDFIPKTVKTETASIVTYQNVVYKNFIDSLNRKSLSLSNDIRSIYNNKGKFDVIYTDDHTHLTKNKSTYNIIDPVDCKNDVPVTVVIPKVVSIAPSVTKNKKNVIENNNMFEEK